MKKVNRYTNNSKIKLEKLKRDKEEGKVSDEEFNNLLEELVPGR